MKSLLILFTLISFSFGQFIETFNDFTGHLNDSTKAKFVFSSEYAGDKGTIDYIGQDWSQGGAVLGSEIITNGTFDTDTDWICQNGWQISNGNINIDGSQATSATSYQTNVLSPNTLYKLKLDYTKTAGGFLVRYHTGSSYVVLFDYLTESAGIKIVYFTTGATNSNIYILANTDFAGTLDNVSIKQLANGNHLSPSTGFDYASQLTGTSPVYENDNALVFDGLDDYWYIPSFADFNLNQGTICIWAKFLTLNPISSEILFEFRIDDNNNCAFYYATATSKWYLKYKSGGTPKENEVTFNINTWNYFVITWDEVADEVKTYKNGIQIGGTLTSLGNWVGANPTFVIGARAIPITYYYNGEISSVTYHAKALTADEIKENYVLGIDWYSENAIVIRDTMDWFQGFADTVYTSTGITGNCKIKFNAWGQNGGETLDVWSGSTSRSFTLTNTKSSYSASLQMADGLYFVSTDTVYIDDVESGKVQKGYLQYLQYNDYIGAGGSCKEGTGSFPYYFNMFLN